MAEAMKIDMNHVVRRRAVAVAQREERRVAIIGWQRLSLFAPSCATFFPDGFALMLATSGLTATYRCARVRGRRGYCCRGVAF
jgi:hypothetical protein